MEFDNCCFEECGYEFTEFCGTRELDKFIYSILEEGRKESF